MLSNNLDDIESDFTIDFILISMPGYVYWKDLHSIYMGCNANLAKISNLNSPSDIVGKTDFDFDWGKSHAKEFHEQDQYVINTGNTHIAEHDLPFENEIRSFRAEKRPLLGKSGKIIGIFGFSVDITAEKEAQRLKLENERQQVAIQEKEKFAQLARKVAHDINSPLAALNMMIPECTELPEEKRTMLHRATEGILDIANNLLSTYHKEKNNTSLDVEPRQALLVSDLLIQLLSEKKMQFRNRPLMFETAINSDAQFAFVNLQATEFRRSMSNLINNAVDAFDENQNGTITIQLTADSNTVLVSIQDNGKGMTSNMVEKMRSRESFTEGKENGHGLGLQQVWDTLTYNQGSMEVQSEIGTGTSIQLAFPRIAAAQWVAQDIHLIPNNIIVILDDDDSIHTAWNLRFTPLLKSYPTLRIEHFKQGQEALDFLSGLTQEEKNNVVFLSDYELLHQDRNGLEIVQASGIKRAMLVTSYYSNPKVRDEIEQLGIKILPKQMASIIPILFKNENNNLSDANRLQPPDKASIVQKPKVILLDDDRIFADSFIFRLSHKKEVKHYHDPLAFLDECEKYPTDTPICIDNNFANMDIKGVQIAEQLHTMKFTRLFIVSGDYFQSGELPDYVTLIRKPTLDLLDTL